MNQDVQDGLTYRDLLSRLENVHEHGTHDTATCPACNDANITIKKDATGDIVFRCDKQSCGWGIGQDWLQLKLLVLKVSRRSPIRTQPAAPERPTPAAPERPTPAEKKPVIRQPERKAGELTAWDAWLIAAALKPDAPATDDAPVTETGRGIYTQVKTAIRTVENRQHALKTALVDYANNADLMKLIKAQIGKEQPPKPEQPRKTIWTGTDLYNTEFSDPEWIVPGIIPVGFTLIAGKSKIGKSWLALQLAQAICFGGKLFDQAVPKGTVFYFALEDNPRRMRKRMFSFQNWEPSDRITISHELPVSKEDPDGFGYLDSIIRTNKPTVVIIDTISRYFPSMDQNTSHDINKMIGPIQRLAMDHQAGIIGIHHMNKKKEKDLENDDWFDQIRGSTALVGVADAVLGMMRQRGKTGAILKGTGRDFEDELDLALEFKTPGCFWHCDGNRADVEMNKQDIDILEAFAQIGNANGKMIAEYLHVDAGHVSRRLTALATGHDAKIEEKTDPSIKGKPYGLRIK